ncbi:MAG: CarD family transcriptional regulator, partial [Dehalococcoidia bacterium]
MPELRNLLRLIDGLPGYGELVNELGQQKNRTVVILESARPFLLAALRHALKLPILVVTARPENARKLHEQLSGWSGAASVKLFPETDALPYERLATDATTDIERVRVLTALAGYGSGENDDVVPLIVTSAAAVMGKTPRPEAFVSGIHRVEPGMEIDPMQLLRRWEDMGYKAENVAEVPSTMSHRGGIIDIFPPTSEMPVRLEFFGDTIDSLRYFSPETQRSVEKASSVTIGPATELLTPLLVDKEAIGQAFGELDMRNCSEAVRKSFENDLEMLLERHRPPDMQFYAPLFQKSILPDYLPEEALLVLDESSEIEQAVGDFDEEAVQLRNGKIDRGELPVNFPRPYFIWDEIVPALERHQNLRLEAWGADEPRLAFMPAPVYSGQLPPFLRKIRDLINQRKRIIVVSHQAERLSELLGEQDVIAAPVENVENPPESGSVLLVHGSLNEGWMMTDDIYLFTDSEIFGFVKERRVTRKHPVPAHKLMAEINPGDYVVHVEHGIGKFTGVTTFDAAGSDKEYLVLQYALNDVLYVPTDQIDRVSRYIGASDRPPVLSRLGTQEWYRTRQKAKEAAEELAKELLALYAAREVVPGYAFSGDTVWQQEMEAAFPYVETRDQLQAQHDVKEDMEKAKPMDRLVCGDVGYGKTEVAIRAAFKAVMDGRQVAVLVPTTVLAQQHYATFSERLEAFPIKVEVLSRFRSTSEQHAVVRGLADGTVDICIGTHRLIQKDVRFKDLGLLIIDEEQRFGVNHKEYLKKMRQEVDVLTLSATPIPRTLHMSLVGVRDM